MIYGKTSFERSDSFTRPSNTTQYTSGELVSTAVATAQRSWAFGGEGVWLRQVRFYKSDPDIVAASFRLWLHSDSAVTFTNADNGALSIASSTLAITDVLAVIELPAADFRTLPLCGDVCIATFDPGLIYLPATTYGFIEARDSYTPASAEVFTIALRGDAY